VSLDPATLQPQCMSFASHSKQKIECRWYSAFLTEIANSICKRSAIFCLGLIRYVNWPANICSWIGRQIDGTSVPVRLVQPLNLGLAFGLLHFLCVFMNCQLRLWHSNGMQDHTYMHHV
jgi:hypothetical protein